jgi:RNA polymerase sigma-70 factor (ECF subfamily)
MPPVAESYLLLVQAARKQDMGAWNRLLKQHEMPLFVYIAELVQDRSAALDLAQETFADAVRHIHTLRSDEKFAPWLFSIGHQQCIRHWRRKKRENAIIDREAAADAAGGVDGPGPEAIESEDPRTTLIKKEGESEFLAQVGRLPELQREVFLLRTLEDFSLQEIAAIVDAPVGTVKSRLHHATVSLRSMLRCSRFG